MADSSELSSLVEEATFDFTMGDADAAVAKLEQALASHPDCFEAWQALAEIHYFEKRYPAARDAAEKAHALKPDDLLINTSLSRIWLELGSKANAEKFGAQAKMLGWKEQLQNPNAAQSSIDIS